MKRHELKTWPDHYDAVDSNKKTFEIRLNDRDFAVGDLLVLKRFNPETNEYTGEELQRIITHILPSCPVMGLADGYVILSIRARYEIDAMQSVESNHIWLNAFSCVRPTDEFKLGLADTVLAKLDSKGSTILCDYDGGAFESLKQRELILRVNKS